MDRSQIATFDPKKTIFQLKQRLNEMAYSQATIDRLDSVWRNFIQYWTDTHQTEFTEATMQEFTIAYTKVDIPALRRCALSYGERRICRDGGTIT